MKTTLLLLILAFAMGFLSKSGQTQQKENTNAQVQGKWLRIGQTGPMALEFKNNQLVEIDIGNDQTIDITSEYKVNGDILTFYDKEGKLCQDAGSYKIRQNDYYLSFDLVDDNCNGRIKSLMGFWTKPSFKDLLKKLDADIAKSGEPSLYLKRARIYMAIGQPKLAKPDFDVYIEHNTTDARAYTNRAGTQFPYDMEGVVADCEKGIELDPKNKNAYFLKGLALYELGEKEKACESFSKAIELGFSILKIAEYQKCSEFWDEENKD